NRPIIQPPPGIRPAGVLIQGDTGEGFMTFELKSGAFTCNLCEYGYELKGVGDVKIDGVNIYFSAVTEDYSVFASANVFDHQAKCVIEVLRMPDKGYDIQPITEYLVDSDMLNSKPDCSEAPTK
ncbi:MAG TPA: hypothetical protein VNS63_25085, partial [Blastocatellia bacterium]|nr:hypothetical protein [Blastocatellia bacterium]